MNITDNLRLSDQRLKEWFLLEKARKEKVNKPAPSCCKRPVITISRLYGAGGRVIAAKVAEKLGPNWQVWDKELINAVAESAQVRQQMVESMDERCHSWMDDMMKSILNVHYMESEAYHRYLAQVLLALAQQGNKIILGRGANFVLRNALNIRIEAALDFRVKTIMRDEHLSHEDALHLINKIDHERAEFTRRMFSHEAADPSVYDLTMQSDQLGMDATVACIVAACCTMFSST
jgi:cytidylate kinase